MARIKPFLSEASKGRRLEWGEHFHDWNNEDWMDVIWSDDCAFSVGEVSGTVWVTCHPGEEYEEDCLVPRFARCTTVMVWGAVYRGVKSRLCYAHVNSLPVLVRDCITNRKNVSPNSNAREK